MARRPGPSIHVRRHTSQYGNNTIRSTEPLEKWWYSGGYIPYAPTTTKGVRGISFRRRPKSQKVINGFRPPTAWSMLAFHNHGSAFDYMYRSGSSRYMVKGSGEYSGHPLGSTYGWHSASSTVSIYSYLSAYSHEEAVIKLKDQKVNIGVALAESRKTLHFLADSIARLASGYSYARKGRWSKAVSVLTGKKPILGRNKDGTRRKFDPRLIDVRKKNAFLLTNGSLDAVGGNWLKYQYAFLPLMSDIYGLQEQLKEGFRTKDQMIEVAKQESVDLDPYLFFSRSDNGLENLTGVAKQISKTVFYGKIDNDRLAAISQLGLSNPLLIAWELVPFSFVVDWFIPIGSFLDSLDATAGLTFVAGYEDRICHCDLTADTWEGLGRTFTSGVKCRLSVRQMAFERRIISTWGSNFRPYLKNPFSSTRLSSAMALFKPRS